jgi:imidazolonepropionase-like amidohydrolase
MNRLPRPDAVNRSLLRRRLMPGLASPTAWALALSLTLPATSAALSAQAYDALSAGVRDLVRVSAPHVLIENVRLIDGTGAPARAGASVLVSRGRIAAVGDHGSVAAPEGLAPGELERIDGGGMTLMPGLVMLHEHMFYPSGQGRYNTNERSFPPLYLAGGVTTMRTGGSLDPYSDLRTRELIESGAIVGPHMDVTGPYLEGPGGFIRSFPQLATPQEARDHVNFWMDRGVTSFKAYNLITREVLKAAIDAAHARGAKVTGHLCSITYREAAELGIDNLEHGFFAATDWVPGKEPDTCVRGADASYMALDLEGPAFLDVVDHLIANDVAVTSTLTVVERRAPDRPEPPRGAMSAMLPELRETVARRLSRERPEESDSLLRRYMDMERIFFERGGHLVVGTDPTGGGDVVPGYANQRALQILVEMGLTVEESIMVATLNGARYLEMDARIGSIEVGKVADLVLLEGDPGTDLEAFRRTTLVFKDGVGYDSASLFDAGSTGWVGVR